MTGKSTAKLFIIAVMGLIFGKEAQAGKSCIEKKCSCKRHANLKIAHKENCVNKCAYKKCSGKATSPKQLSRSSVIPGKLCGCKTACPKSCTNTKLAKKKIANKYVSSEKIKKLRTKGQSQTTKSPTLAHVSKNKTISAKSAN